MLKKKKKKKEQKKRKGWEEMQWVVSVAKTDIALLINRWVLEAGIIRLEAMQVWANQPPQ